MIICIPAHNEMDNIRQVIRRCRALYPAAIVLVVDDGSTDQTVDVARAAGAVVSILPRGAEYRDGLEEGFRAAIAWSYSERVGEAIFLDAGLSYLPESLPTVLALAKHADIVQAYRFQKGRLLTRLGRGLLSWLTGVESADYCGLRAFRNPTPEMLQFLVRGTSRRAHTFNPQVAYRILRQKKYTVALAPVEYHPTNTTLRPWGVIGAALAFGVFLIKERLSGRNH